MKHTVDYTYAEGAAKKACRGEDTADANRPRNLPGSGTSIERYEERNTLMWLWMNTEVIPHDVLANCIVEMATQWHPYVLRNSESNTKLRQAAHVLTNLIQQTERDAVHEAMSQGNHPAQGEFMCSEPRLPDDDDSLDEDSVPDDDDWEGVPESSVPASDDEDGRDRGEKRKWPKVHSYAGPIAEEAVRRMSAATLLIFPILE